MKKNRKVRIRKTKKVPDEICGENQLREREGNSNMGAGTLSVIAYVGDSPVAWIPKQKQLLDVDGKLIPLEVIDSRKGNTVQLCSSPVKCYDNVVRPCVRRYLHTGGCNPFSDTDHSQDGKTVSVKEPVHTSGLVEVEISPVKPLTLEQAWGVPSGDGKD